MWSRPTVTAAATVATALILSAACSASPMASAAFSSLPPLPPTSSSVSVPPPSPFLIGNVFGVGGDSRPIIAPSRSAFRRRGRTGCGGDVALSMGLRSFLKKRILRRDDGDGDGDDEFEGDDAEYDPPALSLEELPSDGGLIESEPLSSLKVVSDYEAPAVESERYTATGDGEEITPEIRRSLQEDARERIRRVQKGGMTEEEKMNFLNAALTRTSPYKKDRGPPIRQRIPGDEDGGEEQDDEDGDSKTKSTAAIWNAIAGRLDGKDGKTKSTKSASKSSSGYPDSPLLLNKDGKLRNEEAKRQWIDSVTDPRRFASFTSVQQDAEEEVDDYADDDVAEYEQEDNETSETLSQETDFADMKRRIADDQVRFGTAPPPGNGGEGSNSIRDALQSIQSMTMGGKQNAAKSEADAALAARLEAAALEQERRDGEQRSVVREAAAKKREEEKRALSELQRERERAFMEKEAERAEETKREQDRLQVEAEALSMVEREKMDALQAKQDEYWAKVLGKKVEKREMGAVEDARRVAQEREMAVAKEADAERLRQAEEEAKNVEQAKAPMRNVANESAQRKQNQRRQVSERERQLQMQQQQLKALNSPLPALKKTPVPAPPQPRPMAVQRAPVPPPRTVPPPPLPAPVRAAPTADPSPRLNLFEMTKLKKDPPPPAPAPVRTPPPAAAEPPRLNLMELTRLKKDDAPAAPRQPPSPRPPPPSSSPAPRLNLFEMTRLKKDDAGSAAAAAAAKRPRSPTQSIRKAPVRQPVRQAVRQSVPLTSRPGDDDEEDDDDLMRSSGGGGLTIADAMRQRGGDDDDDEEDEKPKKRVGKGNKNADDRAKQWGIDMSKFK